MAKVIIDAGHGGYDPGEVYGDRYEKDDVLKLALRVGTLLSEDGFEVAYTRMTDVGMSQLDRVAFANSTGGDLLISLHHLYGNGTLGHNLSFAVAEESEISAKAVENIRNELAKVGYSYYNTIIRTHVPVLTSTTMPAVMLGIGFMESDEENTYFDKNFESIARAIATGIEKTLKDKEQEAVVASNFSRNIKASTEEVATSNNSSCSQCISSHKNIDNSTFYIQVGAFRKYDDALEQQMKLICEGFYANIVKKEKWFAVWVGKSVNLDEAANLEYFLLLLGYTTLLVS